METVDSKSGIPSIPYAVINSYNAGNNVAEGPRILARCIAPEGLYYRFNRIREGEEFVIYPVYKAVTDAKGKVVKEKGQIKLKLVSAKQQFSEATMEEIEFDTKRGDQFSTAQQAINRKTNELNATKQG